jgi:hypothetical protein
MRDRDGFGFETLYLSTAALQAAVRAEAVSQ